MNQEKIGIFISSLRRKKKMTQAELGEKLGVTEKSISNWENGRNMPDLSLFKPLCDILGITINELLSGERIDTDIYQEKFEENIVNTIDYSTKKITKYNKSISLIFMIFGLFISISAVMIFPSESSWGSIYSVFGIIVFVFGIWRFINWIKWYRRLFLSLLVFIFAMAVMLFTDFVNVKMHKEAPMFRLTTTYVGNVVYYDTLFYDVYHCNFNEEDEYWVIEKNKKVNQEQLMNYCK